MNVVFVRPRLRLSGEVIGRRLADGRAEDLDHPEVEGDLGDLVQHLPAQRRCRVVSECRIHGRRVLQPRPEFLLEQESGARHPQVSGTAPSIRQSPGLRSARPCRGPRTRGRAEGSRRSSPRRARRAPTASGWVMRPPTLTSALTPGEPSAFMRTTRQSPERSRHVSSCSPVPDADAAQIEREAGRAGDAVPARLA